MNTHVRGMREDTHRFCSTYRILMSSKLYKRHICLKLPQCFICNGSGAVPVATGQMFYEFLIFCKIFWRAFRRVK